jgi:hypothetical protein
MSRNLLFHLPWQKLFDNLNTSLASGW